MEKFQSDDPPGSYDGLIAGVSSKVQPICVIDQR